MRFVLLVVAALVGCEDSLKWSSGTPVSGSGEEPCNCLPVPSAPFDDRVVMLWIGPSTEVPVCPDYAPPVGFEGVEVDVLPAPALCPRCACEPAACQMPTTMFVSSGDCVDVNSVPSVPFNAPEGWGGMCDSSIQMGGYLAQSVTVDAPTVAPCMSHTEGMTRLPPLTVARECIFTPRQEQCEGTCTPVPPDGFQMCVFAQGEDISCPKDYADRHVLWDDVLDDRTCEPCSCGEPACSVKISFYKDAVCGPEVDSLYVAPDQSGGSACTDLLPGVTFQSKNAVFVADEPGVCSPGGGNPIGDVHLSNPVTFCCQPEGFVP